MSAVERRSVEPDRRAGSDRRAGRSERRIAAPDERGLTPAEREVARGLAPFRARLDEIDAELVDLLGERFQICREVAVHKSENEIDMMQPGRVEIVRARYLQHGAEVDLPGEFTAGFFDLMIAATCQAEDELMARLAAGDERVHVLGNPLGDKGHGRSAGEAA